jgi:FKBP12-rapamycin complex-associated protein
VRQTLAEKFGIGYGDGIDYRVDDPWFHNRVVITRVGEGTPGGVAQVPVGAILVAMDGVEVRKVNEINTLLDGKLSINLTIQQPVQQKYVHDIRPSFDMRNIVRATTDANLLAKSLHFCETLFEEANDEENLEDFVAVNQLMDLYQQLGIQEAASGLLEYVLQAGKRHSQSEDVLMEKIAVGMGKGAAFEKLQIFGRAIETYSKKITDAKAQDMLPDHSQIMGLCRCYRVNGYWPELVGIVKEHWQVSNQHQRSALAHQSALASWFLGDWSFLEVVVAHLPQDRGDFFKIILQIRQKHFDDALKSVEACRFTLDQNLSSLIGESYHRAYDIIAELQNLSELEEVIMYMQSEEKRPVLRSVWSKRLTALAPIPKLWQTSLAIRSLVLNPEQDIESWLRFIAICRKWDKAHMAEYALSRLLNTDLRANLVFDIVPSTCNGNVIMSYLKHLRHVGHMDSAFEMLKGYVEQFPQRTDIDKEMKAKCHLMLGEWQQQIDGGEYTQAEVVAFVLHHLDMAKELDNKSFRAWHSWAMINLHAAVRDNVTMDESRINHLVAALNGFFMSVHLSSEVIGVQDVLRILFIWFNYGHNKSLAKELEVGVEKLSLDTWLLVIPQLISRIDIIRTDVREQLHKLLGRLGAEHPHALIYPLTVCAKSEEESVRRTAARSILDTIHKAKPQLVEEVNTISDELVRVAISWWDRWFDAIEMTGKHRGDGTDPAVYNKYLGPLFAILESAKSRDEKTFHKNLAPALQRVQKLLETGKLSDAWSMLKQVHSKLVEKLQSFPKQLALEDVSQVLSEKTTFTLPVPGTYKARGQEVLIAGFLKDVRVVVSKQRPRIVSMKGQDGKVYKFLLKGHEDLRMDERVMQLFNLINTFFENDSHLCSIVSITTYSVVPLSENVGLIRWIENTETMYAMITEFRKAHAIPLYMELNLLQSLGELKSINEYPNLPRPKRREMLQYVIDNTPSDDLKLLIWERNESSESWLEYRSNYIRSTAMMSVVGYILGLGDRHLNNLMLHKKGKTIHIDFGDCFEVAQARERFPETVPFRLTRMLVAAMEACGIEGTFRHMCESVMDLLRKHRDSVTSLLETFAYDPLISWRLDALNKENKAPPTDGGEEKSSVPKTAGTDLDLVVDLHEDGIMSRSCREKTMKHTTINQADAHDLLKVQEFCKANWNELGATSNHDGEMDAAVDIPLPAIINAIHDYLSQTSTHFEANFVAAVRTFKEGCRLYPNNPLLFLKPGDEIESFLTFVRITFGITKKNETAKAVLQRIRDKLHGTDFDYRSDKPSVGPEAMSYYEQPDPNMIFLATSYVEQSVMASAFGQSDDQALPKTEGPMSVTDQVRRLISEATSVDNLCVSYIGWCPFW